MPVHTGVSASPTTITTAATTKPYAIITLAVVLVVGFVLVPTITGIALAYGYLLAPLLLPIVSPLAKLLPARFKEALS